MMMFDLTQHRIIARNVKKASSFFERMKGLIGSAPLGSDDGLWIPKCQGVHTFGMSYTIDVVFLDKNLRIVNLCAEMTPNHIGNVEWNACSVLELSSGTIELDHLLIGDQITIIEDNEEIPDKSGEGFDPVKKIGFGLNSFLMI